MPNKERPLYNAIKAYAELSPARFHMPGHKGALNELDVTEVPGTDNLACPHDAILRLEENCAEAFRARDALISVNGSTACNIAMLLALGSGRRVLLGRSCHKSAVSGMALAGHTAYSLFPDADGVYSAEAVAGALEARPCDAVFITSPTYRGCVSDIAAIAEAAHSHGALLLVDCAHGAHFAFGESLPEPPVEADMWCVSCHKTMNALTQTAVLCLGNSLPMDKAEVRAALLTVMSSSPSYPLMLSIENSICDAGGWDEQVIKATELRKKLLSIDGVRLIEAENAFDCDKTRLNISVCGVTGYALGRGLEAAGVYPEMSDMRCVTLITSPADRDEWYERLVAALTDIAAGAENDDNEAAPAYSFGMGRNVILPAACDVRGAVMGKKTLVPLENSVGRIAAAAVGVYPPGVAALFPGEIVTAEAVGYLSRELAAGAELFGVEGGGVWVLAAGGQSDG